MVLMDKKNLSEPDEVMSFEKGWRALITVRPGDDGWTASYRSYSVLDFPSPANG